MESLARRFADLGGSVIDIEPRRCIDDCFAIAFPAMSDAVTALVIVSVLIGRENPTPRPGCLPRIEAELLLVRLEPRPGAALSAMLV